MCCEDKCPCCPAWMLLVCVLSPALLWRGCQDFCDAHNYLLIGWSRFAWHHSLVTARVMVVRRMSWVSFSFFIYKYIFKGTRRTRTLGLRFSLKRARCRQTAVWIFLLHPVAVCFCLAAVQQDEYKLTTWCWFTHRRLAITLHLCFTSCIVCIQSISCVH